MAGITASETIADKTDPLAIIGLAIRGPKEIYNSEKLWEFLLRARQAASPVPPERFNADAFYNPDPEHGGTVSTQSIEACLYLSNADIDIEGIVSYSGRQLFV